METRWRAGPILLFCHSSAVDGVLAIKSEYGQIKFNNKIILTEESITNRDVYDKVCVFGEVFGEVSWYCGVSLGALTMEYRHLLFL